MDLEHLAWVLRRARLKHDWTMDRLMAESGVDKGTISRMERELVPSPSVKAVGSLERALGLADGALIRWKLAEAGPVSPGRAALLAKLGTEPAEVIGEEPEQEAAASPGRRLHQIVPSYYRYRVAGRAVPVGRVQMARIRGSCLEPHIHDGEEVYVDTMAEPEPEMFVLALVGDALHAKRLRGRDDDDGWELAPENGEPAIPVDYETQVAGPIVYVGRRLPGT